MKHFENLSLEDIEGEKWIDVFDNENYQVSNLGRIKGKERWSSCGRYMVYPKILKTTLSKSGILVIGLGSPNKIALTKIIVSSFLQKPISEIFTDKKICVHHKNFNALDNRIENLEITNFTKVHKKAHLLGVSDITPAFISAKYNKQEREDNVNVYQNGELIERVCRKCAKQLSIDEFTKTGDNRFVCYRCLYISRGIVEVGRNKNVLDLKNKGLKKCYKCLQIKSIDNDFYKNTAKCKTCIKSLK
jgi:hypothetical protein